MLGSAYGSAELVRFPCRFDAS